MSAQSQHEMLLTH